MTREAGVLRTISILFQQFAGKMKRKERDIKILKDPSTSLSTKSNKVLNSLLRC